MAERCVSRMSRPSVALTSAEFLGLPQRWQLRWQNAASAEFLGLPQRWQLRWQLTSAEFLGLRLFLEGFFLQSRDGLGLRLAVGVGLGVGRGALRLVGVGFSCIVT